MWFLIFCGCFFAVYFLQALLYRKLAMNALSYSIRISTDEAVEGEDIYIYEEITNGKALPLPLARVDLALPEGLRFRFMGNRDISGKSDSFRQYVNSTFVLRGHQTISRRWRVHCAVRGVYTVSSAILVTNDLFGSEAMSKALTLPEDSRNTVTVLPKIHPFAGKFVSSHLRLGDDSAAFSLLTDPLRIAGSREYTTHDPMKSIHWKSTAAHGRLMVNAEEFTVCPRFNLLLNMQTRVIEADPAVPGVPALLEECISVCASILDSVSSLNIPVRLLANTSPGTVEGEPLCDEGDGASILRTAPCQGKASVLDALHLLAMLQYDISLPADKMFDHILENPSLYADDGCLVVVSSYLSERMVVFFEQMKKTGVRLLFFITGKGHNALVIPEDLPVYFA